MLGQEFLEAVSQIKSVPALWIELMNYFGSQGRSRGDQPDLVTGERKLRFKTDIKAFRPDHREAHILKKTNVFVPIQGTFKLHYLSSKDDTYAIVVVKKIDY